MTLTLASADFYAQHPDVCYEGNQYSGAAFSRDRVYRYMLWRTWWPDTPVLVFLMVNPSKAGAFSDDNTVRKLVGFARTLRAPGKVMDKGVLVDSTVAYGGIRVVNEYAVVATEPKDMLAHPEPIGVHNDVFMRSAVTEGDVVLAYGNNGIVRGRDVEVRKLLHDLGVQAHALRLTKKTKIPEHPLYLPSSCKLIPYPYDS